MQATPDPEDQEDLKRYRTEVRDWLAKSIPSWWREGPTKSSFEVVEERFDDLRAWHRELWRAGYLGIQWPREYGGQGRSLAHDMVVAEERALADAPPNVNLLGMTLCAPALLEFGSEKQKARYLPRIVSADEIWCQGYSEPGSGSDLASLQTRAVLDGDQYVVNGQKIWSTNGLQADWQFCLVRTDPAAPKHGGIGFLLIDMHSPGVEVSPIRQITGGADFCQVFFTDVRVPRENMVGEPTQGWKIANHVLRHERGASFEVLSYQPLLDAIAQAARAKRRAAGALADDPVFRQRFAAVRVEYEALKRTALSTLRAVERGIDPGPAAGLYKLAASEFEQRLMQLAFDAQGAYGQLWRDSPRAVEGGSWQFRLLWSRAYTIYAGTSEIQRNILSERVLGLPRA
jgi:alkylation response protein AidB-like acyl-CoA dehydrogenase